MKSPALHHVLICALALSATAHAQLTIAPLTSFSGGWLAPSESNTADGSPNPFLGTANNERGLAYSTVTDHLYLVSRGVSSSNPDVRILNGLTGEDLGRLPGDTSLIVGGTFVLSAIAVAGDGSIFASNLSVNTSTTDYRIYRWENETASPTLAFSGRPLTDNNGTQLAGRLGDDLDLIGSGGPDTRTVAGYGASTANPPLAGTNGYAVVDVTAQTAQSFAFTGAATGDFRLGITFTDADTVLGAQNASVRLTNFNSSNGTGALQRTITLSNGNERLMDFTTLAGVPLLATVETGTNSTANTVRVYNLTGVFDGTDPLSLQPVASGNNTTGVNPNTNGVGAVKWGEVNPDGISATLYAMNTNNGIQAFTVTIPEPSSVALLGLALGSLALRRRR